MKIFLVVLFSIVCIQASGRFRCAEFRNSVTQVEVSRIADWSDTVFFDFGNLSCGVSTVDIPVYFTSGSDRYALDFAMRYDRTKLTYQSVVVHEPGLFASAYYNAPDSTLRFTSFCFQPITPLVAVVSIRFTFSASPLTEADVDTVLAYLDGNRCSYKVLPAPAPIAISFTGPPSVSEGDSLLLTVTGGSGYSFNWTTGDTTQSIYAVEPGTYAVTATSPGGCSGTTYVTISSSSPLPVDLVDFRADAHGSVVNLFWTTATEVNNSYFELGRSADGSDWQAICRVEGAGNSTVPKEYSFTDLSPLEGLSYYRLKQVDFDGAIKYFPPLAVDFHSSQAILTYGPNPAGETLYLTAGKDGEVQLFGPDGREVMRCQLRSGEKTQLHTGRLPSGIYTLCFTRMDVVAVQKVILTR